MTKVLIYMACPQCIKTNVCSPKEYWSHAGNCEGLLMLDEYANVHCSRCGKSAPLRKMRFSCKSGKHVFYSATKQEFAKAISMAAMGVTQTSNAWLQSVLKYL